MVTEQDRLHRWAAVLITTARALVGQDGTVEMEIVGAEPPYTLRLMVEPDSQRGRLIGKGHSIIAALRVLTAAWSGRHQIRVTLELEGLSDRPSQVAAKERNRR